MTERNDYVQIRSNGELLHTITIDAHEVAVLTVWGADGNEVICRLELPAQAARRLAAGLLEAAQVADQ